MKQTNKLTNVLREILMAGVASTQEELCHALAKKGFAVNQSKISRLLHKVGATKSKNDRGQFVYLLPKEPVPPSMTSPVVNLIIEIVSNEALIIIRTSPGAATLIARLLDYNQKKIGILGTIAGDDTIFIAPKSVQKINRTIEDIKSLLMTKQG